MRSRQHLISYHNVDILLRYRSPRYKLGFGQVLFYSSKSNIVWNHKPRWKSSQEPVTAWHCWADRNVICNRWTGSVRIVFKPPSQAPSLTKQMQLYWVPSRRHSLPCLETERGLPPGIMQTANSRLSINSQLPALGSRWLLFVRSGICPTGQTDSSTRH